MVLCSLEEAEGLIRRSLAIRAFGPNDVQMTSSLATLLWDTIQLQDAKDACRHCLEIRWAPQMPKTVARCSGLMSAVLGGILQALP